MAADGNGVPNAAQKGSRSPKGLEFNDLATSPSAPPTQLAKEQAKLPS